MPPGLPYSCSTRNFPHASLASFQIDKYFRGETDRWGHFHLDEQTHEFRFRDLKTGGLLISEGKTLKGKRKPYKVLAFREAVWSSKWMLGAAVNLISRRGKADGLLQNREMNILEVKEAKGRMANPNIRRSHIFSTFDLNVILRDVPSGRLAACRIGKKINIRIRVDQGPDVASYPLVASEGNRNWDLKPLREHYPGGEYLFHPFVNREGWGAAIFKRDQSTNWNVQFVCIHQRRWPLSEHFWPNIHLLNTELVQEAILNPTPGGMGIEMGTLVQQYRPRLQTSSRTPLSNKISPNDTKAPQRAWGEPPPLDRGSRPPKIRTAGVKRNQQQAGIDEDSSPSKTRRLS